MTIATALKEREGLRYNVIALLYVVAGYILGLAGLFHSAWPINLVATLLLAHAMTIAAYLIHECGHNLVFKRSRDNAHLGRFLSWICGAAYGTYEDMRYKHFRHHVDNDDVVWFKYEEWFDKHPITLRVIRLLEWFYIPAHDLIMHFIMVFTSFIIPQRRNQRVRNVTVILIRGGLFIALLVFFPKAALLYAIAYMLMMHILRFMDALQHDYPYNATLFDYVQAPHKGDFEWEQEHTFSVPLSLRYPRLNWLTLNFGYHNAHHSDMNVPWYRLPDLHQQLTDGDPEKVIPFSCQIKLYHRNRVLRVNNPQPDNYPQGAEYLRTARTGQGAIGGNAASFLTSF
ncbi:MAG: fatty acid desaturase [Gammaproteobacteria bacterium]|nr:fatty acid desaturase [Gammaproteobacteria bacterium]MDH3433142.1 fatty acid desaturase [Gammaproteobacteria bacterium]